MTYIGQKETKHNIRYNKDSLDYKNTFKPKPFCRSEYHMSINVTFCRDIEEMDILQDPSPSPECDIWEWIKLNHYGYSNIYSDLLPDLKHEEVCYFFRSTCTQLFDHIDMRKKVSFKIRNHLPAILQNQIYHIT